MRGLADVGSWTDADRTNHPRPFYIRRVDLVIEGCFEDPLAGLHALPKWIRHNLRRGVSLLQRRGCSGLAI
jgi:hypothetical protein